MGQEHNGCMEGKQAAGFRPEAFVCVNHENAFGTGPTTCISARTYMRLRFLDYSTVAAAIGAFVSEDETQQLLRRKDCILAYFDSLVQQRGYHNVVMEDTRGDAAVAGHAA